MVGGNWHHGELAVERMLFLRPTIGAAQYAAPIPGLWLAGAGCHPGGGVSGAAGWNAAGRILGRPGHDRRPASPTPRQHWRQPLLPTPFHARTSEANRLNAWGPWGGYTTALAYDDEAMEYTAIRNQASLYDLSPMVKYRITGPDAAAFLDRLTIRNVAKLPVGAVHYTAWCDDAGHLLDDGTLFRHGADRLPALLPGAPPPLAPRQRHSASTPTSRRSPRPSPPSRSRARTSAAVLRAAGVTAVETLKPFRLTRATLAGIDLTVSRTGFTGDLGYELWTTPDRALDLWDALMAAGAAPRPAPDRHQRPQPRPHRGRLHHHRHGLRPRRHRGPRRPRPLALRARPRLDDRLAEGPLHRPPRPPRREGRRAPPGPSSASTSTATSPPTTPSSTTRKKKEVGQITAAAWSPATKRNIALAHLRRPYDTRNTDLWVEIYALRELQYAKLMLRARVTPRPFFNPARRRATPPADF